MCKQVIVESSFIDNIINALPTGVVTFIFASLGFWFVHWLTKRRDRKTTLRQKLEKVYFLTNDLLYLLADNITTNKIIASGKEPSKLINLLDTHSRQFNEAIKIISEIDALLILYFPVIKKKHTNLYDLYLTSNGSMASLRKKIDIQAETRTPEFDKLSGELESLFNTLKAELLKIN